MNAPLAGNFTSSIEGLIEQKRSLGYPYQRAAQILKTFAAFCRAHYPDETRLTQKLVMHWAEKRDSEQVTGLACRLSPVRELAKYMNRLGLEAYIIPPSIPGKPIRYVPHIFTDQELRAVKDLEIGAFHDTFDPDDLSHHTFVNHLNPDRPCLPFVFRDEFHVLLLAHVIERHRYHEENYHSGNAE